jgi:hypothetical protein
LSCKARIDTSGSSFWEETFTPRTIAPQSGVVRIEAREADTCHRRARRSGKMILKEKPVLTRQTARPGVGGCRGLRRRHIAAARLRRPPRRQRRYAAERLPQRLAVDAAVFNDVATRTLVVRLHLHPRHHELTLTLDANSEVRTRVGGTSGRERTLRCGSASGSFQKTAWLVCLR